MDSSSFLYLLNFDSGGEASFKHSAYIEGVYDTMADGTIVPVAFIGFSGKLILARPPLGQTYIKYKKS